MECGVVGLVNTSFEKNMSSRSEEPLDTSLIQNKTFLYPSTSEDPNMKVYAEKGEGNVFMTDSMWSALMAVSRSTYSWDLIVTKSKGQIWFDKRPPFDYPSVNENANDPPDPIDADQANTPSRLSKEAMMINQAFSQQVLLKDKQHRFPKTNPKWVKDDTKTVANVAYIYNKVEINEELTLIVRSEVNGVVAKEDGEVEKVIIRTLNEYDPKITGDWRKRLETQRSGVLATELRNNAAKIIRWTCEAFLGGCSSIEIGLVSRIQPKNSNNHHILDVQTQRPQEFINQMALNINQMWGTTATIIETISELDDGKYLLFRDPASPTIKLYNYPVE